MPSKIGTPTTTVSGSKIIFDWNAPAANGLTIIKYEVQIRKADLVYAVDATVCDGSSQSVIIDTQCVVSISQLTNAPFLLLKGYSVNIRVTATNGYGTSVVSDVGSGALI